MALLGDSVRTDSMSSAAAEHYATFLLRFRSALFGIRLWANRAVTP